MFQQPGDRAAVEAGLASRNVHPDEIDRLAALGDAPETAGQELVSALQQVQASDWYIADPDGVHVMTNVNHTPAVELERKMAAGIGPVSVYGRLYVDGTDADPLLKRDADVIHVNCATEDLRFTAAGPRILTDGRTVPLPSSFFRSSEGYHIPYDVRLTPALVAELFRTLRPGGVLLYAPSERGRDVELLLIQAGFAPVQSLGPTPRSVYNGRLIRQAFVIRAVKP